MTAPLPLRREEWPAEAREWFADFFEDKAAVLEFCGGFSRVAAEERARAEAWRATRARWARGGYST